ncbi:MAG: arachidonate 15-lipoxygenase [Algicola sp.]|nr:arachidonate 15-lipoxygenase [Algicola sp.]
MMGNSKNQRASARYEGLLTKKTKPALTLALPQQVSQQERDRRQYDLSLQRLNYNYMRSYPSLENVPVSAELPEAEMYDTRYEGLVDEAQNYISHNFQTIVYNMVEKQLTDNVTNAQLGSFKETGRLLQNESGLMDFFKDITKITSSLPTLVQTAADSLSNFPGDIQKMYQGFMKIQEQTKIEGPTAFLKSTLYDMLAHDKGRDYLHAKSVEDYQQLHQKLPKPLMLTLPQKPWMKDDGLPCNQDWFFAHLQVAGFNTTMLAGVTDGPTENKKSMTLADLQAKMPISDLQFQRIIGDNSMSLQQAARLKRLFVCDYHMFDGLKAAEHHGDQRYIAAPIAIFYWNPSPPLGYQQDTGGALQPVAIQCEQRHHTIDNPIFCPNDACNADDSNGLKWKVAKYIVNASCAIHHESIAHFGECHLTVEPCILATHRQLSDRHPLHKLLMPHFRFSININDDARHKLIAPGGVIATNVGPAIDETLKQVAKARLNWRWDDNRPDRMFKSRSITQDELPLFPFRDDTLLLWKAVRNFVSTYIKHYYADDRAVAADTELQEWIHEMTSPLYAGFEGMRGLVETDDDERPYRIESLDYLIDVIAHLIYLAGPQHANANYAQYPLMSYMPCVAGTIYNPPPTRNTKLQTEDDLIKWYPPLDVALYTFSFEYLLSSIQYDKLGYYDENLRHPYFDDAVIRDMVEDFQEELALIEIEIRKRNKTRPYPYTFQLPSKIPNSISI